MRDGSIDITAWIQRMVRESGLSSVQLQFHNTGTGTGTGTGTASVAAETKPKEETLERAEKTIATKETVATGEWKDLDTLLFPEDKEG